MHGCASGHQRIQLRTPHLIKIIVNVLQKAVDVIALCFRVDLRIPDDLPDAGKKCRDITLRTVNLTFTQHGRGIVGRIHQGLVEIVQCERILRLGHRLVGQQGKRVGICVFFRMACKKRKIQPRRFVGLALIQIDIRKIFFVPQVGRIGLYRLQHILLGLGQLSRRCLAYCEVIIYRIIAWILVCNEFQMPGRAGHISCLHQRNRAQDHRLDNRPVLDGLRRNFSRKKEKQSGQKGNQFFHRHEVLQK